MKVYIVIERCEDSIDFNPIKNVYYTREDAKEHLDDLVEYYGATLTAHEFEFYDEETSHYAGIEEWIVT